MTDMVLERRGGAEEPPTLAEVRTFYRVLRWLIGGHSDTDQRKWMRLWYRIRHMKPGELFKLRAIIGRYGPFHRFHMAVERAVFEAQEQFEDFDVGFRGWLKLGAGHCEYFPRPDGGMFASPKSTSYEDIDDGDFREFHDNAMRFLRSEAAARTLWPRIPALTAMNCMHAVLAQFDQPKTNNQPKGKR